MELLARFASVQRDTIEARRWNFDVRKVHVIEPSDAGTHGTTCSDDTNDDTDHTERERQQRSKTLHLLSLEKCRNEHRRFMIKARNDVRQCYACRREYTTLSNFSWSCHYHAKRDRTCCVRKNTLRYERGCLRRDHVSRRTFHQDTSDTPLPLLLINSGCVGEFTVDRECLALSKADPRRVHIDKLDATNSYVLVMRYEPVRSMRK